MSTITFTDVAGLGSVYPETPPELKNSISAFGFPMVMKRVHNTLKAAINRIPKTDPSGTPMREFFLKCVAMDLSDSDAVEKYCNKLGFESALQDLQAKRITQMTAMDFIVDPKFATPDDQSFKDVVKTVVGEENKRFSRVAIKENQRATEWDELDGDDADNGFGR